MKILDPHETPEMRESLTHKQNPLMINFPEEYRTDVENYLGQLSSGRKREECIVCYNWELNIRSPVCSSHKIICSLYKTE